jgi:hypothetical protein
LAHIDKFKWGFPLIDKDWKKKDFNKFNVLIQYPNEWKEHVGRYEILKRNQTDDFDILVRKSKILNKHVFFIHNNFYNFTQKIENIYIPREFSVLGGVDEGRFCESLNSIFSKSSTKCNDVISNSFSTVSINIRRIVNSI